MKLNWKILKVFLSSTFKDLEITRDRLTNIFEKIERTILKRSLTIRPYDLRWRDRHSEEDIVKWCIRMVQQCDYFVGILGNRYGWRPPLTAEGNRNNSNISMTEMEIKEALQTITKKHRFFCFTTFQNIEDEKPEDVTSMEKLKKFLQDKGETVYICNNLEELLTCIEENFSDIIDNQYPSDVIVAPEQLGRVEAMDEFVEEKLRGFVGREQHVQQMQNFAIAENRSNYFILRAVAGTGKSALMGKFMRVNNNKIPIIAHFLSIDGGAREVKEILFSLVDQLYNSKITDKEPQGDIRSLRRQLQESLENHKGKLVLLIDGIDEVEEDGQSLFWLPRNLPQNIRIIITTRPVETWQILQNYPFITGKEVPVLKSQDITQIIDNYMQQHSLEYNAQDRDILQQNCAGNPLYLKVGLDELQASGNSVAQLAITVDALFIQILERLENKYQKQFDANKLPISSKEFFEKYLGFIAAGRTGVLEKELQDILKIGDDLLLPISKSLSNFIITRNGFLNFFHPEFERTIKIRIGKQKMRSMHQGLAKYLDNKGLDYIRSLDELPYQLQWSEQYHKLLQLLTSLHFLEQKSQRNLIQGLRQDFSFALRGQVVRVPETCNVALTPEITVNKNTIRLIHKALEIDFHLLQREPANIFQCLWNRCFWHDCPELEKRYDIHSSVPEKERIYRLAKKWSKEIAPGKLWLRSLRPLPERIDSAVISTFRGHTEAVHKIHIWKHKAASASKDQSVKIWDLKTEICLFTLQHHHQVNSVCWSPQGDKIVSAAEDGYVKIWNAQTGEEIDSWNHVNSVSSVDWSPDGKYIVSGSRDGKVRVWNVANKCVELTLKGHKGGIFCVRWSPNGDLIASASKDKNIHVWDWQQQKCVSILRGHQKRVLSVSWNFNGTLLASASYDQNVRIWRHAKEKCIVVLRNHHDAVTDLSWHPKKSILASSSEDKTIRVWDTEKRKELFSLEGVGGKINCVTWTSSLDLISGKDDSLIQIWHPQPTKHAINFEEKKQRIRNIAWHPEKNYVASVLQNKKVQIWDIAREKIFCVINTAPQTFNITWVNNEHLAILGVNLTIWDWRKQKRVEEIETERAKQDFYKWKSSSKVSTQYAVQSEKQETLVLCDEGKMSYFPAILKNAVCLESGHLTGHSQDYLYIFKIEK